MFKKSLLLLMMCICGLMGLAQDNFHPQSPADQYQWPAEPNVLDKLHHWQDLKFGILLHWGIYSVPGIVESWSICVEDWITRDTTQTYQQYRDWYFGLADQFNPTQFDPTQWASVARQAGMKYMIFTTKHHDGFCMFDSEYSDYGIAHGPFKDNPKKDVAKYVFNAFRSKGFMTGAYFSKPDWHHKGFWNPYYATPDRHPNYDIKKHPDWWQSYVEYTKNQLKELTGGRYGKLDILWLDGGWITGDEVGINEILPDARKVSPGLICVDRTIKGPNENYQTPEQSIPKTQINHPWESCITLTDSWGWVPDGNFKSSRKVVGILAEIVAKGGCLVLGVGPTPEGLIEDKAIKILDEIGEWLNRCGEAIYSTRIAEHYNEGNLWFSKSKDGKTVYAVYALEDGKELPSEISWSGNIPKGKVTVLNNGKTVKPVVKDGKVTVKLPKGLSQEPVALKF